jgi:chromosome segregation ATPase
LESADRAVDAAVRASAAASRDLADKEKTLNDLLKAGAVDKKAVEAATKAVTDAEKDLTEAQKDAADAATELHDAEKVLADLRSGATAAKNAVDHADDVGKAQLEVRTATKRLGDAQDKLTELQNSGTATARELSDADDDVAAATFGLHDANANLITTQDNVNKLLQVGAENSPEVVAAVATVEGAHDKLGSATQHVADALGNVATKQAELGTALAGDPNFADSVRAARQAVADATQHVADAMYNVAQNRAQFEEAQKILKESVGAGGPNAVDQVRSNIEELLKKKPELALFFDPVLADLREAAGVAAALANPFGEGTIGAALINNGGLLLGGLVRRAAGGPINGLSLVGEKGPELFAGRGTIIPNNALGGGATIINVTVHAGMVGDADRIGQEVYAALRRIKSRNGNLGLN